jgi:TolA-binding protein
MPVFTRRIMAVVAIAIMSTSFAAAQSTGQTSLPPTKQAQLPSDHDDLDAMKADLAKMRVLVTQLQNNLGLTTNTTTPLYHQFELEINMWQLTIAQMERRIERLEQGTGPSKRE